MMNTIPRFAAFAALALSVACSQGDDLDPQPNVDPKRVDVTLEAGEAPEIGTNNTRVDYEMDGTKMKFTWKSGDAISLVVSDVTANANCRFSTIDNKPMAKFTGSVEAWSGQKDVYGIFPYNSNKYTITSGKASLDLPTQQRYKRGDSRVDMFMVGKSSAVNEKSMVMNFKQVTSFFKFDITGVPSTAKVVNVRVSSKLADFPTSAKADLATVALSEFSKMVFGFNTVVESAVNGGNIAPYIAFLPVNLTNKELSFEVTLSDGKIYTLKKTMTKAFVSNVHYRISLNLSNIIPAAVSTNVMRMTIDTQVTSSTNKTFHLPVIGALAFDLTIDWGDGTSRNAYASILDAALNPHIYTNPGVYQITITSSITDISKLQMLLWDYTANVITAPSKKLVVSIDTPLLNTGLVSMLSAFEGFTSLRSIPGGLFSRCEGITDFTKCFYGCSSLLFIPAELFEKHPLATNFTSCFDACTSLVTIPSALFEKQILATTFNSCFHNCQGLQDVPAALFAKNVKVVDFVGTFDGCIKLKLNSDIFIDQDNTMQTRFVNRVALNFSKCFNNCGSSSSVLVNGGGIAPELWKYTYSGTIVTSATCFAGVTKVTNAIDAGWK